MLRAAWVAGLALLAGCAFTPEKTTPLVAGPTTVRPVAPVPAPVPARGAIFQAGLAYGGGMALFEDRRARQVGDVLTILVRENSSASKSSAARASRDSEVGMALDKVPRFMDGLFRGLDTTVSGGNSLDAKGGANASNSFNGQITVTVLEVLGNGNLRVAGEKQMLINQGTESIRFSGVVDPRSVGAGNTVLSTQVADARLEYSAKGYIDEAQTMGWLQRFFLNVLPL